MSAPIVCAVRNLRKFYDRTEVLKGITLAFLEGAKIGVIGSNGSGKSTLLRVLAGVDRDVLGEVWRADGLTVGYVGQEPQLEPTTVLANLEHAVEPIRALLKRHDEINEKLATDLSADEMEKQLEKLSKLQEEIEHRGAWELDHRLELAMEALRTPPPESDVAKLSGGERRRVALCKVLLSRPDILLLDEPTNHLDAESVAWLEKHLAEYPGLVILVTHDRYFLDNVVGWMLEIERGRAFPYEGNYSTYLEQKASRLEVEEKQESSRQKVLARELEWIRTSPKARTSKHKARIAQYEKLLAEEREVREDAIDLQIPAPPRLGDRVIRFHHVTKGYGDRVLLKDLTFDLPPGSILGIVGPNGAGKTTLLRLVLGQEQPDAGTIEIGSTVKLCYVDQLRDTLDPEKTVFQEITGGLHEIPFGKKTIAPRAYVARFNFRGPDQEAKVGEISGGQRNRVQLAKMLRRGGNVLLLDEPTNDLDLQTLRVLEEAIDAYAGCAVVVTHDRYFLDRVATHVLALDGDGSSSFVEGDWAALTATRGDRSASTASKHRKLG
ncbi:MAG TPA: energy-dependent translational throttle protein EttA [Planctomycetota bacterium]|nr:energy-dependent translational throttle protein EttA [Planctomycetota bacterium]